MAGAYAHFPLEVLGSNELANDRSIDTSVAECTTVAPVVLQAREESQRLEGEQIVGVANESVQAEREAILQQIGLQAHIEATGNLGLQL